MAHWAQIDENNIVVSITVGNNEEPDEGYQWLVDNLGGTWIKTSYNSLGGIHYLPDTERDENGQRIPSGLPHLRYNFAKLGSTYDSVKDLFIPPKPDPIIFENTIIKDWALNETTYLWEPYPKIK